MWLLRLLAVLLIIGVSASGLTYVFTGQRRYLELAWRILRYGLVVAAGFFVLLFLERLILLPF